MDGCVFLGWGGGGGRGVCVVCVCRVCVCVFWGGMEQHKGSEGEGLRGQVCLGDHLNETQASRQALLVSRHTTSLAAASNGFA
jgi:hypothetical protein